MKGENPHQVPSRGWESQWVVPGAECPRISQEGARRRWRHAGHRHLLSQHGALRQREEPHEVLAWMHSTPDDPRFREVEETMHFVLRFPSGFQATCHTSYGAHKSKVLRLLGSEAWVEREC